nr:RHS repeat-associated core domain-containing protein [Methylosinus sp. Sm6]
MSGHNGRTGQSIKYTAFGATQSTTGASPSRLKYTGREDDGAGLYYYRARYYDPAIGRFISEDPKGFAAGDVNFYVYATNNPINFNDPSGEIVPVIAAAAAGCIAIPSCVGAFSSVAIGGAIRGITGGTVLDPAAIGIDAAFGAAGVGLANKISEISAISRATTAGYGSTKAFRVEGAANSRIDIDNAGNVIASGVNTLFLNFGSFSRAQSFINKRLSQGLEDSVIKSLMSRRHL